MVTTIYDDDTGDGKYDDIMTSVVMTVMTPTMIMVTVYLGLGFNQDEIVGHTDGLEVGQREEVGGGGGGEEERRPERAHTSSANVLPSRPTA